RPANQLALERISVEKISDATAETTQEETGRRCPMANEKGRLIDDRKAEPTFRKDRPRPLPASARVEIVTMEKKYHHSCPLDALEQRIEPDRIEAPGLIEFVEAPEGRRSGGDDRIDIVRGIGGHQREKGAERLPGQHDATIPLMLELGDVIDQTPG